MAPGYPGCLGPLTESREKSLRNQKDTHVRVEPQLANITRDDLLLFGHQGDAKRVVYDGLLHRVHLRWDTQRSKVTKPSE